MGKTKDQRRQERYARYSHPYFEYFNANPYDKITTDCVIRAISTACNIKYRDVVMDFAKIQCETGEDPSYKETWSKYIEKKGWKKMKEPRKWDNTRFTVSEYIKTYEPNLTCIANLGTHHIAAVVNGKVLDVWDSSEEVLHTYWVLEG